ncbi:GNAT family N-acetyltransferase [Pseudofulvibacter geojedonensis]|uniref:GNAT family N-acetyltransferase n=1 Tax=Pseudofulvibacter geojedonensis TaxID=1123758 RepID=A0ABW3I492_9FLAO
MNNKYLSFTTERLILKPTSLDDAEFILALHNTPLWLQFIGDRKTHTIEDAKNYIKTKMLPQLHKFGYGNYTVIRKKDNAKIGTCGLFNRDGVEGIDIGFAFLPDYHNQGYAYESANIIKEAAITNFNIKQLSAITMKENLNSQKLLEKLGLVYIKDILIPDDNELLMLYKLVKN